MTDLRRSPMPPRTVPLRRVSGLVNGGPLIPSRMPPRTALITSRPSPSRVLDMAAWAATRPVLFERAGHRCERCGCPLTLAEMEAHHRQRREMGDHSCANGACLCSQCHREVHAHPHDSIEHGWIVPTWADPRLRSVPLWDERIVHLTTAGGYA